MPVPRLRALEHRRAQEPWLVAAPLDVDGCSDEDLQNLAYFGVRGVLATPSQGRRADTGRALVAGLAAQLEQSASRLSDVGIRGAMVAGVSLEDLPRRSYDEVWPALEMWAGTGMLRGVGPISLSGGPRTWPLLVRQAEIAVRHGLRLWLRLPAEHAITAACRVVQLLPPHARPALGWLDAHPDDVEALLLLPGLVSVRLGQTQSALALLARVPAPVLHETPRLVLGFASATTPDVLAMARIDEARQHAGYPDEVGRQRWDLVDGGSSRERGEEARSPATTVPA